MTDPTTRDGGTPVSGSGSIPASRLTLSANVSPCLEQWGAHPGLAAGLQPIAVDAQITPELDRTVSALARAARAGDLDARNALYSVLEGKIRRFVRRYRGGSWAGHRSWDDDDLAQEAFLVFVDLVTEWTGEGSFTPYFLAYFPWRLRDAVRRLNGARPFGQVAWPAHDLLSDGTAATGAAIALLESLAAGLPATSRAILLWHVRDGERFGAIATRLGISRRTVHRHWEATLEDLRRSLRATSGPVT